MKLFVLPLFLTGVILLLVIAVPVSADDLSSLTSVSPEAGYAGESVIVTITGVNFTTTQGSVRLEKSGDDDIDANSISSWGTDTIVCKFIIDDEAEEGDWDLVVTRGYDDLDVELSDAFTIISPMALTSISPTTGAVDDTVDFSLVGSGLTDVEEVYLYNEDYDNITADDVDAASTKVTGTFDLSDADEDDYEVCVVNSYDLTECDLSFEIATIDVGSIAVSSNPTGASIYVDGTLSGTTPGTVEDLVEGSHKIILKKTGYEDWGKIVTVEADDETEVDADLSQITTATPTAVWTAQPMAEATAVRTAQPTTVRTTRASTIVVPTSWPGTTDTPASPIDPAAIIGVLGLAFVALRKH